MNPAINRSILLRLLAISLISALIGGVAGFRLAVHLAKRRANPEQWNVTAMNHLDRRLNLTPEQHTQVQAEMDQAVVEMKAIRLDTIARTADVIDRLIGRVEKEMITPEQKATFAVIKRERHDASLELLMVEPRHSATNSPAVPK